LVKNGDIVGGCKLPCAQQQILGDAGHDVEFVCCSSYFEGIFHNFSCPLYLTAWDDKSLVEESTSAPTRVISAVPTPEVQALFATIEGIGRFPCHDRGGCH
jgi:hypothetical protein